MEQAPLLTKSLSSMLTFLPLLWKIQASVTSPNFLARSEFRSKISRTRNLLRAPGDFR